MAHVQTRQVPEVIPGAMKVGPEVLSRLIELLTDDKSVEVAAAHLNRAWSYGEIDGPSAPVVAPDGRVIDPDKQRGFAISEISCLAALPEVIEGVRTLQAERAQIAAEERKQAKVEQLALARLTKAAKTERRRCPLLYRQVAELTTAVEWLLDRAFDEHPGFEHVLPELKDDDGLLTSSADGTSG